VLADEEELPVTGGFGPEPAFIAVVASAIATAAGLIPEGDADVFTGEPAPVARIGFVPHETHPVLPVRITSTVTSPQLPADEALKGGIGFIDEGSSTSLAELTRFVESQLLVVVEQVAFAVVRGAAPRLLIAELRAVFDRRRLVGVNESLADGQSVTFRRFQVNADESARHGRIARQEERASFLDESRVAIANGVDPQIGAAVPHSNYNRRRLITTAARFAEIQSDQLDHVRLQEIDVPPR